MPRRNFLVLPALLLALALTAGCSGGAPGGKEAPVDAPDLVVTYFSHAGRTDVCRDQPLEIRFTAPVDRISATDRTIRILTGPNLNTPVPGALEVKGNRVVFYPTRSQKSYNQQLIDGIDTPPDLPYGFEPLSDHRLYIPSPHQENNTLLNRGEKPILREFYSNFRTSEFYLREMTAPRFVGIDRRGELGFTPPRNADGSVKSNASVVIEFDEAISPDTMDPGLTLLIKNLNVKDGLGQPLDVPGTVHGSGNGRTWTFTPSFGYGTGPYTIEVTLTDDIEDLSGNPLANPGSHRFETEYQPLSSTVGLVKEDFSTNGNLDLANTTGEWNSVVPGELRGGAITTTISKVHYVGDGTFSMNRLVDYPLVSKSSNSTCNAWPNGTRVQASYTAADIGASGAITDVYWGPSSNALFAAAHPTFKMRLGHTKDAEGVLGATFADNYRDGEPQPQYAGTYGIPQDADVNSAPGTVTPVPDHWPFPSLTVPFDYDGADGLLVDWEVAAANDCQVMRVWHFGVAGVPQNPGNRNVVATDMDAEKDDFTGGGQALVYDMAFKLRRRVTQAQSNYYDTGQAQPDYAEAIVSPPVQEGGAEATVEWQGADAMPDSNDPGQVVADPSTTTPWSTSIDTADGHRFVRFRVKLEANLNSETVPRIDAIQIPYSFRTD